MRTAPQGALPLARDGRRLRARPARRTNGTIARATLTFGDWYNNEQAPGGDIVATAPWNEPPDNSFDPGHPVSVYCASIQLDASRTVRYVALPSNDNLHVFWMATGG